MSSPLRRLSFCVPALAALVACSAPPGEDVSQAGAAVSPSPNDQAAFDYFIGKGLTSIQAAGIVGNLDQESQVDPTAVQAGGPGRGIAQWSVGGRWDTDANDNVLSYASTQGESSTSLTLQLEFIWYELTTFSGYGLSELRAATNVTDATVAFETYYEGCGECDQSTRIAYAQDALDAYGSFDYGAAYVSQSFPLASTALKMTAGETVSSYIELRNTGTKSWDAKTRIGTTQPRDRASAFAASTWIAPNRPAGVTGSVAPGATYKFTFDLHAPATPGTYFEYFGVVEDGVAWFSDPGQGGPPDDDLEVQIVVAAGPKPPPSEADGGESAGGGESDGGEAAPADDAGGGSVSPGSVGVGPSGSTDDGGAPANGASANAPGSAAGGCAMAPASPTSTNLGWLLGLGALGAVARRRSRRAG
jgi:MYXO-CTERM domain-containing protein